MHTNPNAMFFVRENIDVMIPAADCPELFRRRLFQPIGNEQSKQRDAVARAFSELYAAQQQEFPSECREADYERRIKMAYPIHPELFDRVASVRIARLPHPMSKPTPEREILSV